MAFVFDINELDLGELEDFAEATGIDPLTLTDGWQPTLKAVRAFVWLVKRREDPALTPWRSAACEAASRTRGWSASPR